MFGRKQATESVGHQINCKKMPVSVRPGRVSETQECISERQPVVNSAVPPLNKTRAWKDKEIAGSSRKLVSDFPSAAGFDERAGLKKKMPLKRRR